MWITSWSWAGAQSRLRQLDCNFKFGQMDISFRLSFSLVWIWLLIEGLFKFWASQSQHWMKKLGTKTCWSKNLWSKRCKARNVWWEKNGSSKHFDVNCLDKEKLGLEKKWSKTYFFQKMSGSKKLGWSQKIVGPKKYLLKKCRSKNLVQKNFGSKRILVQKESWSKKNFGPKRILVQKEFLSKKNFGPKKLCLKNSRSKNILGQKKFGP